MNSNSILSIERLKKLGCLFVVVLVHLSGLTQKFDSCFTSYEFPLTEQIVHYPKWKFPTKARNDIYTFSAVMLEKVDQDNWIYAKDSSRYGYVISSDTLKNAKVGSKMVSIGVAELKRLQKSKDFSCLSLSYDPSALSFGDVLNFSFCIISDDASGGFCPNFFVSKNLIIGGRHQIKNKRKFVSLGACELKSEKLNDVVKLTKRFEYNKDTKNFRWIHIVADYNSNYTYGLILSACFEYDSYSNPVILQNEGPSKQKLDSIFFSVDSYDLAENEKLKIKAIFDSFGEIENINLSAYADKTGKIESNYLLARNRLETIKSYLIQLGVTPQLIQIGEIGILPSSSFDKNRVCVMRVR